MNINKKSWSVWLIKLQMNIKNSEAYDKHYEYKGTSFDGTEWTNTEIKKGKIPTSLCPYFWTLILSIIMIPINIPGLIIGLFNKDSPAGEYDGDPTFTNWGIWSTIQGLSFVFGVLAMPNEILHSSHWMVLVAFILGIFILASLSLIIVGIVMLVEKIKDKLEDRSYRRKKAKRLKEDKETDKTTKVKKPGILSSFYKAHKEKVCPMITFD